MINFKLMGQRIKKLRQENAYTQEQLAEKLDISTEHLSRIETGSYRPSLSLIENICEILKTSEATLMFGSDYENQINKKLTDKICELSEDKKQALSLIIDLIK